MRLGFILYDYFPFGGLQRDCLKIAEICAARGNEVTVIARTWQGDRSDRIQIRLLGRKGFSNIARNRHFFTALSGSTGEWALDGLIGFNRAPGLDVYYAADPCYQSRIRRRHGPWYRWLPRYKHYLALEHGLFVAGSTTQVLLLTPKDIPTYQALYGTETERLHVLPPGIARCSLTAEARATAAARLRRELQLREGEKVLLFVGSGFRTKGLDRAIDAFAAARRQGVDARLLVVGQNPPGRFRVLAQRRRVADQVHFLGGRDDVLEFMISADLLIHPAYSENTGTVLLEALALGLPVLCTDVCGFASHVAKAKAGTVLMSPFNQDACNRAVVEMLTSNKTSEWRAKGLAYAAREDLYSCHERAADIIEETIEQKLRMRSERL